MVVLIDISCLRTTFLFDRIEPSTELNPVSCECDIFHKADIARDVLSRD